MQTTREQITPYITRDGSVTRLHKHLCSEELYHVLSGSGRMTLGERIFAVKTGDTICIAPGVAHQLENTKDQDLVILCCCAPPYSHADTKLL
jgi:mannose-6-phosphate isomerase-like protein (cupin superfamily)